MAASKTNPGKRPASKTRKKSATRKPSRPPDIKREESGLYRCLIELCPDAVAIIQDERFVYVNPTFCRTFGYAPEDVADGLSHLSIVQDKDRPRADQRYRERLAGKKVPHTSRIDLVTKAGRVVPSEIAATLITYRGRPADLVIIRDLGDRLQTERALQESEEKFRELSEQSPNMIFINQRGRVVYANRQCETMTGYSRDAFYAADFDYVDLIAPEYREAVQQNFRQHMAGREVPPYEYEILTRRGERLAVVITTRLIDYEGAPAILGIVTDISRVKETEARLRQSTKRLAEQQAALERKNVALQEILAQIETEKIEMRKQVTANVTKLVLPVIRKLRGRANEDERHLLDVLERNVADLTSRFGIEVGAGLMALTPREVELCNMIRGGLTSKEMAETLNVSLRTIETHRNNIRHKLGLANRGLNLVTYLQQLD